MATRTRAATESRSHRKLRDQPVAFLGLFLAPFGGLLTAWAMHLYINGFTWKSWHLIGSPAAMGVTTTLIGAGGVVLAYVAWHFAEHRRMPLRIALTGSVATLSALFGANVGTGPHRWWSFAFIACAWFVAVMWSLARLNVTRSDPREPVEGEKETWLDKIGLKGYRGRVVDEVMDDRGRPLRTEVEMTHAPGGTIEPVQGAVPNIESYVQAPANMSRATGTDRADRSHLTIMHQDALRRPVPIGPPSHPGGSIADPVTFAIYDTGHPVWCRIGGGPGLNPSGYGFMGMARTGKTVGENQMITELITRTDVVIMYLNLAKGMQDVRPIIPGVEVAIISDAVGDYRSALNKVKRIMTYRSNQLGLYGISAWSADRCFHNPPQRRANGEPIPMEPMPALVVHVGEADAILQSNADEFGVYLASKGLSLGVIAGWSLQRASHDMMPTSLRFNIGAWWCFGCGDDASASFALSDNTVRAGAHPENWKQSKPGYHFFEGPGVDEEWWPRVARTMSAPTDEEFEATILSRTLEYGPRMARLDRGSADATRDQGADMSWWDLNARHTADLRARLTATANLVPQGTANPTANLEERMDRTFEATPPRDDETAEHMDLVAEVEAEMRGLREVEGVELYPADEDGTTAEGEDPREPLPPVAPDDDVTWEDERPDPPSRNDMILSVHEALRRMFDDPAFHDPSDPTGDTIIMRTADLKDLLRYRSRSWLSGLLSEMCEGLTTPPPAMTMERLDGRYRVHRLPPDHPANHPEVDHG